MVEKIAENFNWLSRAHQRYRHTTDGNAIACSERNVVTFARNRKIAIYLDRGSCDFDEIWHNDAV